MCHISSSSSRGSNRVPLEYKSRVIEIPIEVRGQYTVPVSFPPEKKPTYLFEGRLGEPQSRSEHHKEYKNRAPT
jgi:hypothetical protein